MATFISTIRLTGKGLQGIQDTIKRSNAFKAASKKMGVKVTGIYWTLGPFDGVIVFDAPDDETAKAAMLQLTSQGYVHTTTARPCDSAEIERVVVLLSKKGASMAQTTMQHSWPQLECEWEARPSAIS